MPSRAGSPNKNKQALIILLQAKYPDYHPVLAMAEVANDETNDLPTRFNAHKEVAQYVTPKLKAVEHSGSIDSVVYKPIVKRFDGTLDKDEDADS